MLRKITFLATLIFLTSSILAQRHEYKGNNGLGSSFLKNWLEKSEKSIEQSSYQRQMAFKKHSAYLKSSQTIKQRLDSLIIQTWNKASGQLSSVNRYEYSFDVNGNMIQELTYQNSDVADRKYEYTFDTNGNLTQQLSSDWVDFTEQWRGNWKVEYTYDVSGNITQELWYDWDYASSQLVAHRKYKYTFDSNGKLAEELQYQWDYASSQLVVDRKYEYIYDTNGKLTQQNWFNWDYPTSQFVAYWKSENIYDANGNLVLSLSYSWDKINSQWGANYLKTENIFDVNGNRTERLNWIWDETTNQWNVTYKEEYIYDANGNMTQELWYQRDYISRILERDVKFEYTYDNNKNITQAIENHWDEADEQWMFFYKANYTYNNLYSFSDLIYPYEYSDEDARELFDFMLTSIESYLWDETSNDWAINSRMTYYYSEQINTSVSEINEDKIRVYPNPVSEFIQIELPMNEYITGSIVSITGRQVAEFTGRGNFKVQTGMIASGYYSIRIASNDRTYQSKIVILK